MKLRLALFLLTISLLAGCGTPGAPQPPSLQLPKPIEDLQAVRRGDKVYLTWTAPNETTDGEGIRWQGKVRVCRALQTPSVASCRDQAGELPLLQTMVAGDRRQTFTDDISSLIHGHQDFLTYNVIAASNRGRVAGPSNPVAVFLAPSAPAVTGLRATVEPDAVRLEWSPASLPPSDRLRTEYSYRVMRVSEGTNGSPAQLPPQSTVYRDKSFAWEKRQTYTVFGVTKVLSRDGSQTLAEFEGEPSAPVTITPHDAFPPAAPQALQAVFSGGFIDLTWRPNVEPDIAGYNIYRSLAGEAPRKLNAQPVISPAFRDDKLQGVTAGAEVTYMVTALDTQGNESAQSQPATERVPR